MTRRGAMGALLVVVVLAASGVVDAARGVAVRPGDCAWAVRDDSDRVNVAFPDDNAHYWLTEYAATPGVRMTIRGRFPRARYMSFHLYEGSMPIDAIADYRIEPSKGSNPFRASSDRDEGGSYKLRVLPGPRPTDPAPNTLYAQGLNGEPVVGGVIIYRLYLWEGNARGGVAMPEVHFETAAGPDETVTSPLPSCEKNRPQDDHTVNDVIKRTSLPSSSRAGMSRPEWEVTYPRREPLKAGPVTLRRTGPFFPNLHNVYLQTRLSQANRALGDVLVFRAKAPTFPDVRGAARMTSAQVRYWSVCTYDFTTTRYVDCLADEEASRHDDGYMTVVISDRAHRPDDLRTTDNWIASGPSWNLFVLYRHMLPDPAFDEAIHRVPYKFEDRPRKTMHAYYPNTRLCTTERFERDRCGLP